MKVMTAIQAQASGATIAEAPPIGGYAGQLVAEEPLPLHAATEDEPIPALGERPWDGPDMNAAAPIEQMLSWLRQLDDDDVGYLELWRRLTASIGCSVLVCHERDGEVHLMHGSPCDAQVRHRTRWMCFLIRDLDRVEARRDLLMRQLVQKGPRCDKRRVDPRATTAAVRDFIKTGGRILLTPDGYLDAGAGVPRQFLHGIAEESAECVRASRTYFDVRQRLRSDSQIKRAVRMLGKPTDNGWIVLERKGK